MKEKILISACLCGCNCKYNGKNNLINELDELKERYHLIYICPETSGGLKSPRDPAEIIGSKVLLKNGEDVTTNFLLGARKSLEKCLRYDCKVAILKESSPSCGVSSIYDGTFSGKKIKGNGLTTRLLLENGIKVYSENDLLGLLGDDFERI